MMPGADGIQILREAKRSNPESIVIIMTGYASLDTAIQAIRGGAYDYIRKPFKLDELEILVSNACEKISLMRENRHLFDQLKEALGEIETLKKTWDEHLANLLGIYGMISDEKKNSEMEFLLNQIYPIPPNGDFKKHESQEISFDHFERLVRLRKEGWITEGEFLKWKALLLKGWNTDENG
jgi:YesN/AraC family two-component response regulator